MRTIKIFAQKNTTPIFAECESARVRLSKPKVYEIRPAKQSCNLLASLLLYAALIASTLFYLSDMETIRFAYFHGAASL